MNRILKCRRAFGIAAFVALIAGCGTAPTSGGPIAGCPDGTAEQLTVSEAGTVEHSDGTFLKLVDRSDQKLVLVDFGATWCGPCQMLSPHLEQIKKEWGDKIEIVKVDADTNGPILQYLGVNGIPDVRIYRGGTQVDQFVGYIPQAEIESILKSLQ